MVRPTLFGILLGLLCMPVALATPLPDEAVQGFYQSCVSSCTPKAGANGHLCPQACQCAAQKFKQEMTYEDMVKVAQEMQARQNGPATQRLNAFSQRAILTCTPKPAAQSAGK